MGKKRSRKADASRPHSPLSREQIEELTLFDNIFMGVAFDGQIELTQKVLRIIMRKADLIVLSVKCERSFINIGARSIRIDVFAHDSSGRYYNIEVQRAESGADFRRMRFHASLITSRLLPAGEDFKKTPDVVVIFICETDVFKHGLPFYEITRYNHQTGEIFDDGEQIVVVNGEIQDETPLGQLMHDFHCKRAEDAKTQEVRERLEYMKNSREAEVKMGSVWDELFEKQFEIQFAKQHKEVSKAENEKRVRVMVRQGRNIDEIAEVVPEFTVEEIRAIEKRELAII